MIRRLDSKVWASRSQQTTWNVKITIKKSKHRRPKPVDHSAPVVIHHVHAHAKVHQIEEEEYVVVDREKEAVTGRWVLNVIAAHEEYQKSLKINQKKEQSIKKKQSFHSIKSSRVEPIEIPLVHSIPIMNQDIIPFAPETKLSPTTIGDDLTTSLSSFSSASTLKDIRPPGVSNFSSRTRSEDYSTEEFKDDEDQPCVSTKVIIACTIIAALLIIGIIAGIFVTIFVGKSQSTNSTASGKSRSRKSVLLSLPTINETICPTTMFNLTDPLCQGQISYQYYSCYQMVRSRTLTIRFSFQHETVSGHWYFDDISAVQDANVQLIINGGFKDDLTGWNVDSTSSNSTPDAYVDTMTGFAHMGSAYFTGVSKNSPVYLEQTLNVIVGEYIHISFWWRYDGGVKVGNTCQAIGQLIPS